jgi:tetratricopeptide (TPR) repeat protein
MDIHSSNPRTGDAALRLWAFRIILALFPVLFFLLLELVLRWSGYGDDLALFTGRTVAGIEYLSMNPGVKSRYFVQTNFQPGASPDVFARTKIPGTLRLFCLGESTTVGYPYWYNASFSSFLRRYFERALPDRRVEVINLAMTATNSFTVLDEAREILACQPDAVIVYDGHNEFYGALGVASRESVGRSRWMVQLYLSLLRCRTFLLLRDGVGSLLSALHRSSAGVDRRTMMEKLARGRMVPQGSALYHAGVETFRENLYDLSLEFQVAHIPLILCTQVSSLAMPPFASLHAPQVPADRCRNAEALMDNGRTLLQQGHGEQAAALLRASLVIDSSYALTHYLLGAAYDSLDRDGEAEHEYREARDKDPVRFRACTDLNRAILSCGHGAHIADVEAFFTARSAGPIGNPLLMEHVHPSVYGQFLIAQSILATMRRDGIVLSRQEWTLHEGIPDTVMWMDRTVTPLDERIGIRKTEVLTAGWPFREHERILEDVSASDTLGLIAESYTRGRMDWRAAHASAGAYYVRKEEYAHAAGEYRTIALTLGTDAESYKHWARFALRAGNAPGAREALEREAEWCPDAEGEKMLGDLLLAQGDFPGAEARYRQALTLDAPPALQGAIRYARSLALLKLGRIADARGELELLLQADPGYPEARELLSRLSDPRQRNP